MVGGGKSFHPLAMTSEDRPILESSDTQRLKSYEWLTV
jgi:hypothetical protein